MPQHWSWRKYALVNRIIYVPNIHISFIVFVRLLDNMWFHCLLWLYKTSTHPVCQTKWILGHQGVLLLGMRNLALRRSIRLTATTKLSFKPIPPRVFVYTHSECTVVVPHFDHDDKIPPTSPKVIFMLCSAIGGCLFLWYSVTSRQNGRSLEMHPLGKAHSCRMVVVKE